jgi:colicin import membrane protein
MDELIQIALFVLFALFSLGSNLLNKRKKQQAETRKAEEETEAETRRPHSGRPQPGRPHRRAEVSSPDEPEQRRQPSTFEEILRELTGESPRLDNPRQESPRPGRKSEPQIESEAGDDDYEHPFSSRKAKEEVEKGRRKVAQKAESFEKYKEQGKKYQGQVAQKISDKINIEDQAKAKKLVVKKTGHKGKSKRLASSIAASLKDANNARKAIILSEIINRKHF